MRKSALRSVGALLAGGCLALAATANAQVKAGDTISKAEVDKVKDLVSPGVAFFLKKGMTIKVVDPKPIGWPKVYKEATEKFSAQVKLASDGVSIDNYTAGMPFPTVDPNDPKAALKLMWDYEYRPYPGTDDFVEFEFPVFSGGLSYDRPMNTERQMLLGEVRRLYFNGRLVNDPKPIMPSKDDYRFKELLGPVVAPFDLKGLGALSFRYRSAAHQDDTWLYLPTLRRVRRLSTTQRSDALFGQDTDPDSYWGYNGHIAWQEWKLLGEKEMLAVFHGASFPLKRCEGGADFTFCDNWEKRKMYVIEGKSKLPQYAYGKRVLYIDKESMVVGYSDIYDQRGEIWKVWLDNHQFRTKARPESTIDYPEERDFYAGFTMVDIQLGHATYTPHPGPDVPDHDGWYFDSAEKSVTRYNPQGSQDAVFTIQALIGGGGG